jgi:hypothetical protein
MSSAASTAHTSQSTSRKDPAWEHALPLTGKETKNQVGCKYCKNYFNGGITRFKKHSQCDDLMCGTPCLFS